MGKLNSKSGCYQSPSSLSGGGLEEYHSVLICQVDHLLFFITYLSPSNPINSVAGKEDDGEKREIYRRCSWRRLSSRRRETAAWAAGDMELGCRNRRSAWYRKARRRAQPSTPPSLLLTFSSLVLLFPLMRRRSRHRPHFFFRRGGKVLTWGRGSSGQLGHGDLTNCLQPQLIRSLDTLFISHVSAGWNHSGFVSDTGRLFTCGDGSFGQLGHGDYQSYASPVEVSFFGSKHVDQIACGMRHSLVLERGGQVYGFGSGKRGQLGVSKYKIKSSSLPQLSLGLEDVKIGRIYANGDHSAALSADGQLYSWGRGFSGAADASIPHCSCTSTSFTQAALGWNHALALTSEGELFMLGGRHHGSLGDPEKISQVQDISELSRQPNLCKVPGLSGMNVSHIAAGAEHSALVTDRGEILTWGWGEHGQLGLGNTNDQTHPRLVRLGHAYTNPISSDVYCGSGFTIAQSTLPTFGG